MIPAKVRRGGSGSSAMQGMEEGVQSFPHLEAQRGILENLSIYSMDIIFQSRSASSILSKTSLASSSCPEIIANQSKNALFLKAAWLDL